MYHVPPCRRLRELFLGFCHIRSIQLRNDHPRCAMIHTFEDKTTSFRISKSKKAPTFQIYFCLESLQILGSGVQAPKKLVDFLKFFFPPELPGVSAVRAVFLHLKFPRVPITPSKRVAAHVSLCLSLSPLVMATPSNHSCSAATPSPLSLERSAPKSR